jgi:uncharacterized membrane protein HdeD (DUF308 family)
MRNLFGSGSGSSIIRSIVIILVGGVFLFIPGLTIKTIMMIIGAMLLVNGLISLFFSNLKKGGAMGGFGSLQGLTNVVFGIIFITSPSAIVKIFMIFIGIILLIMGLLQVMGTVGRLSRSIRAWIIFLIGVVTLGSGGFLLSNPYKSAEAILPFLGAVLILNGISGLFMARKSANRPPEYKGTEIQDITYEEVN